MAAEKITPCAICLLINPLEVYPAVTSIDLALKEGTLRIVLCEEHNAAAQRLTPLLVRVPDQEEENDGTSRD